MDPSGLKIEISESNKRKREAYLKFLRNQIIKMTGYSGYEIEGNNIVWKEDGEINGGSALARAVMKEIVTNDKTIYIMVLVDTNSTWLKSNYNNGTLTLGEIADTEDTTTTLFHEFLHAFTEMTGIDDRLIINIESGVGTEDAGAIDMAVRRKLKEATAIIMEEYVRIKMGYKPKDKSIGYIGVNDLGQFPFQLPTSDKECFTYTNTDKEKRTIILKEKYMPLFLEPMARI